jgi:fumarate reductase flavoprotein subunit
MPRLYAAGEDTGGVHGANRLGGNGVANSTVFGGLAGDSMAAKLNRAAKLPDPDKAAIDAAHQRAYAPLGRKGGDLEAVRRRLYQVMWDDVGILRTAEGLTRAMHELNNLATTISLMGVPDPEKRYNLTWMDRLNLENLVLTSRAICAAAQARKDSRGAHYREDFPDTAELSDSRYTVVRAAGDSFNVATEPVMFSRVKPGQSLLPQAAE